MSKESLEEKYLVKAYKDTLKCVGKLVENMSTHHNRLEEARVDLQLLYTNQQYIETRLDHLNVNWREDHHETI